MSAEPSRRLPHMEAIIEAIAEAMREDPRVFYIGQDVGAMGGSMQGTAKGAKTFFSAVPLPWSRSSVGR